MKEEPQFDTSGAMLDASRNAVLKVQEIKNMLRKMAVMGLSVLLVYTEDTYEVEEYPYFGYMRGIYTEEELKTCDEYAADLGIEMIPCIQTLAHLSEALKWNYAAEIKDTADILLVGELKTYDFLEAIITAASRPFNSNRIHIGMDEAHQLGLGKYLKKMVMNNVLTL
ncbi:family 20 glycosylhydrolase [Virgibacillus pantothenticus]|uniref:family 20 glycosylhydrolase n=1 Tax=Virgibacillus pantothenticus TaxID=1473 RepID=UPI0009851FA4|nr:family 20 glycosylhydrolase [Virgibacillus pantothenticus]